LVALVTELRHNEQRRGIAYSRFGVVPFERGAFDLARSDFAELPDAVALALQVVDVHIANFNATVGFETAQNWDGQTRRDYVAEVRNRADATCTACGDAATELDTYISQSGHRAAAAGSAP